MRRDPLRLIEIIGATYGWWWSFWLVLDYLAGQHPLWWAGVGPDAGRVVVWLVALATFLAAVGERINGRWRHSPALRVLWGLTMTGVMWWLAIAGWSVTLTAWATYSALGGLFIAATVSAWAEWMERIMRDEHAHA